jgi:peptide/nickel transport system ATP-binding protein
MQSSASGKLTSNDLNDQADPFTVNPNLLLQVNNLSVDFTIHGGNITAVKDVSLSIDRGETLALVGESGSGKSVTAQAILGILPKIAQISGGNILFADPDNNNRVVDIAQLPRDSSAMRAIRGGSISIIFQEPMTSLSPVHTIGDQISEALFLHRSFSKREGMAATEHMLDQVGFPNPSRAMRMYPFELSGGLRQRAMIAMAMVCHPALLIADEPTTALDVTMQARILELINQLQLQLNMAVLIITHDLGVVANVADRVVVMYHGEITESGPVDKIFSKPGHPYLKALLHSVPHFDMAPDERLTPVREAEYSLDAMLEDQKPAGTVPAGPHLEVKNLSKSFNIRNTGMFGGKSSVVKAVNNVSFTIDRGECFGLVGESGCGKTTLSKMLMLAQTPDQGDILFHCEDDGEIELETLQDDDLIRFRRKMQLVFQDPFASLNPRMTVLDILREPLIIHDIGDEDYQREWAKSLTRLVGLDPRFLSRYPHSFSGGQRQRIGIARALALKPKLIVCDEPVSALDVSIQAQILNLLKDLQQELGLTYLFITHNLAVVNYVADRIAVMCKGHLVELATKQQLFENPIHPYTKSLLAAVPHPDPSKPLDFAALDGASGADSDQWPDNYSLNQTTEFRDMGGGHFVRVGAGA